MDTGVKTEGLLLKSAFGEQLGVTGSDGGRDRGPGGWKLRTHRSCCTSALWGCFPSKVFGRRLLVGGDRG